MLYFYLLGYALIIMSELWIKFLQKERRIHLQETLVEMATISSVIYIGASASGLIAISIPTPEGMNIPLITLVSIIGIILGIGFYAYRNNFPLWLAILHIFVGIPLIGITIWAGHIPSAAQISILYIMSSIYSFHFLHIYASGSILLLATACFAIIAYTLHWPAWQSMTILLMGSAITVGIVVHLLVKRLHNLATTDSLTGLYNRHTWDTLFAQELSYADRSKYPLTLMSIDLNNFKQINDTQGHLAGDKILQQTAKTIKEVMRDSDITARWGGDEFVVLLRNCDWEQSKVMRQRLHDHLNDTIKISTGLTNYQKHDTTDKMLARADKDMYEHKLKASSHLSAAT